MAEKNPEQNRQISSEAQRSSFDKVMRAFRPVLEGEAFRRFMEAGGIIELPGFAIASEATIETIRKREVLPPANKE